MVYINDMIKTNDDSEMPMAKSDLYNLARNCIELYKLIKDLPELEGWTQAKITRAADYITSVLNYMKHETDMGHTGIGEMASGGATSSGAIASSPMPMGKKKKVISREEASPMIKPPSNRFDTKAEAFAYAKEHGGKVTKSTYINPRTATKTVMYYVKKDAATESLENLNEGALSNFRPPFRAGGLWVSDSNDRSVLEVVSHGSLSKEVAKALNQYVGVKEGLAEEEVWDKPNPVKKHKKLSPAQKSKAKARAKAAGRKYPNMVDNIWAAKN